MSFYILVSKVVSCIRASFRLENQYNVFVKVTQDGISCFHLLRSYILFMRQPQVGTSRKALWEIHTNFCLTTMQFTLISYAHVLSLELAALAITCQAFQFMYFTNLKRYIYSNLLFTFYVTNIDKYFTIPCQYKRNGLQ